MKRLNIDLAQRSYEILIGRNLLEHAGEYLSGILKPSRVVVITHPSIRRLYGDTLAAGLAKAGFPTDWIEVPEGEPSKSLQQTEKLYDRLLAMNCDRQSVLIALGGGVIGDLTGFVAATFLRGVPFIQVPTTLLSQVDSSVGGKTGVNHPRGKNLIGAFYQPRLVVIDLETLKSLPAKEFRAGLAEIIKYGVIADAELFSFLETRADQILSLDTDCLSHIIETSCAIKARVVEKDERESNYRMVLNFGHTFGHAIEALTGYSSIIHGEAVAIGMVQAAELSRKTGRCSEEVPQRIAALTRKLGLPTEGPPLDPDAVIQTMYLDKKATGQTLRFILVRKIGSVEIADDVPESLLKDVLQN